ncbi:MAG TPA: TonB-dependent receptor [Sphingomicrobium sp.]|jgi:outer membrane receptor protein involved in Fe transport
MIDRRFRILTLGLLATTAMASPAFAQSVPPDTATQPQTTGQSPAPATNATDVTAPPVKVQKAQEAAGIPDQSEIIITATKREENLQNVPISVQVLGNRKLDQLNISNFEEYTRQLPSVSYQNFGTPGATVVYMRGVATGGDGNHSGSLPSVGSYLDEQPITTIGGTLDVHIYDIARIESLAGPQGTLYGASSEAGTIRIITNKPELGVTTGRVDGEVNKVDHGGWGGNLEGMINIPIAPRIALRAVAFWQHDAGYIDNIFEQQTYLAPNPADNVVFDNSRFVKNDINDNNTYGGRVALKVDLDDNWTVTPTFMYQRSVSHGVFWMDEDKPDLVSVRYQNEVSKDRFWQAALTIEGKIANFFDVTYAGAYMDRPRFSSTDYNDYTDAYDRYYTYLYHYYPSYCPVAPGGLLACQNYTDNNGNPINPRQHIVGSDHFKKMSQELRVATPSDRPVRGLVGLFYQNQKNHILQDYLIDNLATSLSVPGWADTLWLTNQQREDKDYAIFGEGNWDITPQITLTAGTRYYKFDNTIIGFNGFGQDTPSGSSLGYNRCLTVNGLELRNDPDSPLVTGGVDNTPCTNVGVVADGKLQPKRSKGNGWLYRFNAQWKPAEALMFYVTWSKGYRPGGINRQPTAPAYAPDFLTNYEAGWKTTFLGSRLRWNGAIYHQKWEGIQFSFLGPNSLTVIQNGRNANINGVETDINYVNGGLSLSAAAAYTDAKTSGNICNAAIVVDPTPDCTGMDSHDPPRADFILVPSGTRLPVTPKFKASATARYTWPMWSGHTHVQGSIGYQGSAPSDLNPDQAAALGKIRGSTLIDLFLGYDWGRYSAELFGTNIFDKRNEISRFFVCASPPCDQVKIIPGRPRTIGLRVGAHF